MYTGVKRRGDFSKEKSLLRSISSSGISGGDVKTEAEPGKKNPK